MLQLGSKGQEVKELQQKLISRGYSVGSYGADGDFGQGTYDAVKKFQKDHGLDSDGIVGPDTMKAINGSISDKILRRGDKGSAVKELQQLLISKGYSIGSYGADGDFGQGTYDAVIKFQGANNLSADGIVGPATWGALYGFNGGLLRLGDKGQSVKELQQKLISRGYSVGSSGADGDFGQGTYSAVIKFQEDNQLLADGIAGPATLAILNGGTDNILLKLGSKGQNVKRLQEKLISRGYSVGSSGADGDFGQGTYNAVVKFQKDNGLDPDGVVGQNTWYALNSLTGGVLLFLGSNGPQVKKLQELLINKGYSVGSYGADGDFGQGTYNAVVKFQKDKGLDPDGIVGPTTWSALGGTLSNGLLRLGSKGSVVKELQQKLISRGYSVGSYGADGDFGQGTHNAVIRFQEDNQLSADGIVGPATWGALNGFSNGGLLKLGSNGPEVKRLQQLLISKGYSVGSSGADGDFGKGTYNAVVKFQKDKGLDPDGIVGPATWDALNGNNNYIPNVGGGTNVAKFLKIAISQIGYKETPINITKYGAWYGIQDEWCAIFVSWCASEARILNSIVPRFHYCATGANWYRSKGRYRTRSSNYTPKPGDVIFFYNPFKRHPYYHTGIVEYTSGGRVHTVEGNTADQVARRSYPLNYADIGGYGTNGGTFVNSSDENILKKAGNIGLFKGTETMLSGFNVETPMNIVSVVPLITARGKVSLRKIVDVGKRIQVTSDAPRDLAASLTQGAFSSGLTFDFTQENLRKTLQGINASITAGDYLTYKIELLPGLIVEATMEYKLPIEGRDVYQAIIIRFQQTIFRPVGVPVVANQNQQSLLDYARGILTSESVQTFLIISAGIAGVVAIVTNPTIASYIALYFAATA